MLYIDGVPQTDEFISAGGYSTIFDLVACKNGPGGSTMYTTAGSAGKISWVPLYADALAWYDASDHDTITAANGLASVWADKSVYGVDMVQNADLVKPQYTGSPSLLFGDDGPYPRHMIASNHPDLAGRTQITVCAYFTPAVVLPVPDYKPIIQVGTRHTGALEPNATCTQMGTAYSGITEWWMANRSFRDHFPPAVSEGPPWDPMIVTVRSSTPANGALMYLNGTQMPSDAFIGENLLTNGSSLSIAAALDTTGVKDAIVLVPGFEFALMELIVLPTVDLATVQKAEGYIAWKWNRTNFLDLAHPYRNVAPTI